MQINPINSSYPKLEKKKNPTTHLSIKACLPQWSVSPDNGKMPVIWVLVRVHLEVLSAVLEKQAQKPWPSPSMSCSLRVRGDEEDRGSPPPSGLPVAHAHLPPSQLL